VIKFLEKGHKVRVTLVLKGREMAFFGRANEFLTNFQNSLGEKYESEGQMKRMGNRISKTLIRKS